MERHERYGSASKVIAIGFWVNAGLMIMKLLAGHFGNSKAVFADGMESAADFIALGSSMIALRIGSRPCDEGHPYGHGRAESIAAVVVSLVIFATGGWILVRSMQAVVARDYEVPSAAAVGAAFLTILIKESLHRYSDKAGRRLDSPALLAVAKDHRKDALSSAGTLIGVTGAFFGLAVLDPIAAGITSLFIFHIGFETFMGASHDLMDGRPDDDIVRGITALSESVAGVEHVHEIRCRRSGQYVIVDLKLDMNPDMTVRESHAIATDVKKLIFERYRNVGDVMIHINPHDDEHQDMIRL